jgi:DNA-binding NtrC family response regulator
VKAVGEAFGADVSRFLPFVKEDAKAPKSVVAYHELLSAAMFAYRSYRDVVSYPRAIECLSRGVPETSWDAELVRLVEHYRRYGHRELVGKSAAMKELRDYIGRVAAHPEARVLILGESGTGKETVALQIHTKSPRRNEPFYAFNCASVNPELFWSAPLSSTSATSRALWRSTGR